MSKSLACALILSVPCALAAQGPETRSISLREAIQLAKQQNPELRLARLQVEKSASDLGLARSERATQVHAGSGLGATYGIPQSIQGAAPSVALVTLRQPLVDLGRSRRAEVAAEDLESGRHDASVAREKAVFRVASLYLDFEFASREVERLRRESDGFARIEDLTAARVEEGVEIALARTRARLDEARAEARLAAAVERVALLEEELREMLGLGEDMRLEPATTDVEGDLGVPADLSAPAAVRADHPEIVGIEARVRAAELRVREARSGRYPTLDLVGQYAMLARFNNYDDYFRRFERHNWQAGVALQVPIFTGRGVAERVARARIEERELELRRNAKRAELRMEGRRAATGLREAERGSELAKHELEYARESLDVLLAQFDEGRVGLDDVERARVVESSAWGGYVESRYRLAQARLAVAYAAGDIAEAFGD